MSDFNPYPCFTSEAIRVQLHGYWVILDRCGHGSRARVDNAPAEANLSIDRTRFGSPWSCGGEDCYLTSAEVGMRTDQNPRYYFRDDSYRSGSTLLTQWVYGTWYCTRACLLLNGYYQCSNQWYADTDG